MRPVSVSQPSPVDPLDHVLDLRTVLKAVLKWSWIIMVFSLAGLAYGVNNARNFEPSFTAKMIISPQVSQKDFSSSTGGGGSGLTSKLAAVLGTEGSSESGGMFERLKLIMKSQQLAKRLDERHGLSREIFASRWDSKKGTWKPPVKVELTWRQKLDVYLHQTQKLPMGTETLSRAVGGMVRFVPVEGTLFWEVQVRHVNPDIALRRLTIIFAEADALLREQDREKMLQQVKFLQDRVKTARLAGLRAALFGAMIGQEKSLHMMESGLPYSATIVEPAFASALRTTPNLAKMIGIPVLGACFAGVLLVLLVSVFVKE
jgi:hypothetical protein